MQPFNIAGRRALSQPENAIGIASVRIAGTEESLLLIWLLQLGRDLNRYEVPGPIKW